MKIEKWIKNITSDDIDLIDKLSNMCENEISEELFDLIDKNEDKYYPRIEAYIKEHAIDYKKYKRMLHLLWHSQKVREEFCPLMS